MLQRRHWLVTTGSLPLAVLTARKRPQTGTGALETMEEQVDLFDALPQTAQLAYLRSTVKAAPDMVSLPRRPAGDFP